MRNQRAAYLGILFTDDGSYDEITDSQLVVNDWERFFLRAVIDEDRLQFYASPDGKDWKAIGPELDASKISDDYGTGMHFTGAFIGICAQDVSGSRAVADFDYFSLES